MQNFILKLIHIVIVSVNIYQFNHCLMNTGLCGISLNTAQACIC